MNTTDLLHYNLYTNTIYLFTPGHLLTTIHHELLKYHYTSHTLINSAEMCVCVCVCVCTNMNTAH